MKKIIYTLIILFTTLSYSQSCENCCNNGYKDFVITIKNGVKIGFKIQKVSDNERGKSNGYSIVAYAMNTTDQQLINKIPAFFKIVGYHKQGISEIKKIMNVRLGDNLPANSGIISEKYFFSVVEPHLKLNGFIQGIWRKK